MDDSAPGRARPGHVESGARDEPAGAEGRPDPASAGGPDVPTVDGAGTGHVDGPEVPTTTVGDARLLAWMAQHGVDPDTAARGDAAFSGVSSLASDLVLRRGADLSARDVAGQAGVPISVVVTMFHDLGIAVPDLDAPQFTDSDITLVERLSHAADVGIMQGSDLLRVVAGAIERIAEAAVAVYVQGPEEELHRRGASVLECARTNVRATELALDLGTGLAPVFQHHMRRTVARQRVVQQGVARRAMARLAIGFVDLVGSTTMQAGLDPDELGALVSRFEATAFDVVTARGGRLVKFIGDAIMFAAADPAAGCGIVGDLVEAFTAGGTQPRGGLVYGEVLFRHGDYYGPVVNLAARLVDAAIPGEVLVDAAVVDTMAGHAEGPDGASTFEPAGRRMLKGFADPVRVWTLATTG
jgi:class 3 adenylate cyclase